MVDSEKRLLTVEDIVNKSGLKEDIITKHIKKGTSLVDIYCCKKAIEERVIKNICRKYNVSKKWVDSKLRNGYSLSYLSKNCDKVKIAKKSYTLKYIADRVGVSAELVRKLEIEGYSREYILSDFSSIMEERKISLKNKRKASEGYLTVSQVCKEIDRSKGWVLLRKKCGYSLEFILLNYEQLCGSKESWLSLETKNNAP